MKFLLPAGCLVLATFLALVSRAQANGQSCQAVFNRPIALLDPQYQARDATPADRYKIIRFVREVRTEMGLNPSFSTDGRSLVDDLKTFKAHYPKNSGKFFVITDSLHQIVGTAGYTRIDSETCELKKVYVDPANRSKNLASHLLEMVIAGAEKQGYKRMVLQTNASMIQALSLYHRFDFELTDLMKSPNPDVLYLARKL